MRGKSPSSVPGFLPSAISICSHLLTIDVFAFFLSFSHSYLFEWKLSCLHISMPSSKNIAYFCFFFSLLSHFHMKLSWNSIPMSSNRNYPAFTSLHCRVKISLVQVWTKLGGSCFRDKMFRSALERASKKYWALNIEFISGLRHKHIEIPDICAHLQNLVPSPAPLISLDMHEG